jgi:nitrate reductase gamma subunit
MCFLSIHFVWTVWEKKNYQTTWVEYTQADDPIMFYVAIGIGMFSLVFHFGLLLIVVKFLIEKLPV